MQEQNVKTITWKKDDTKRKLDFDGGPLVMGIINCTPDSFYPGSRRSGTESAIKTALAMADFGADIVDVGGESTRPGSEYVEEDEEIERVIPVIRGIRENSDIVISVDTRKASVAESALDAGADIVNDVSALRDDPDSSSIVAERKIPVILMHMRGTPQNMQKDPFYHDPVQEITDELRGFAEEAEGAGIARDKIILDPGIGFGKRSHDNLIILKHLSAFKRLGYPVLIGLSRKSFLGKILARDEETRPVEERLYGTLAAHAFCAMEGADILRVHDVAETVDVVRVLQAIRTA